MRTFDEEEIELLAKTNLIFDEEEIELLVKKNYNF
jgi:hypothetical protein